MDGYYGGIRRVLSVIAGELEDSWRAVLGKDTIYLDISRYRSRGAV